MRVIRTKSPCRSKAFRYLIHLGHRLRFHRESLWPPLPRPVKKGTSPHLLKHRMLSTYWIHPYKSMVMAYQRGKPGRSLLHSRLPQSLIHPSLSSLLRKTPHSLHCLITRPLTLSNLPILQILKSLFLGDLASTWRSYRSTGHI